MSITSQEEERLRELYAYEILDTMAEKEFDGLTRLASRICGTDMSLINLLDATRQWTKSSYGIEMREVSREETICQYTIQQDDVMEIKKLDEDPRTREMWYVQNDPGMKYYAGAPLITPNGYKLGALCVIDTAYKDLDKEQLEDLEIIAGEVMARLELRRQKRVLEEVNRQKDELMKIASHDIRNPLMGIKGATDLMLEEPDLEEEDKIEMLKMIRESGEDLLNIVSELLESDLVNLDKLETKVEWINPFEAIQKALKAHAYSAKAKSISIQLNNGTEIPAVKMDRQVVTRIVGNLVNNSIKFTPRGGEINILLNYSTEDAKKGILKIKISDSGVGMSDDDLNSLFNAKGRGREGTEGEPSHGLGLYIVKKLVQLYQGTIEVESEENKGTTFYLEIPVFSASEN